MRPDPFAHSSAAGFAADTCGTPVRRGWQPMLSWLDRRRADRLKTAQIYGAVVTQAREPALFASAGIPDTMEGRYEAIVLHLFLVLERLRAIGGEAATTLSRQAIEALVTDMDDQMREIGISDLAVPRKVRRAAALFYERSEVYRAALADDDDETLAAALAGAVPGPDVAGRLALARYVRACAAHLAGLDTQAVLAGRVTFLPPAL